MTERRPPRDTTLRTCTMWPTPRGSVTMTVWCVQWGSIRCCTPSLRGSPTCCTTGGVTRYRDMDNSSRRQSNLSNSTSHSSTSKRRRLHWTGPRLRIRRAGLRRVAAVDGNCGRRRRSSSVQKKTFRRNYPITIIIILILLPFTCYQMCECVLVGVWSVTGGECECGSFAVW